MHMAQTEYGCQCDESDPHQVRPNEVHHIQVKKIVVLSKVSMRDLIVHLYNNHGNITPEELQAKNERMKESYDPNVPIKVLMNNIDLAVAYQDFDEVPYTVVQIFTTIYTPIFKPGMYNDARK